jgi:hypothetical protein
MTIRLRPILSGDDEFIFTVCKYTRAGMELVDGSAKQKSRLMDISL